MEPVWHLPFVNAASTISAEYNLVHLVSPFGVRQKTAGFTMVKDVFWESRTEIDIVISHKIAESRDIRFGYLARFGVPLVPHFFDCSMNMETSNLCGS